MKAKIEWVDDFWRASNRTLRLMNFIRRDPGSPIYWTREGSIVIGFKDDPSSNCYLITENSQEFRKLLQLCDGKVDFNHLLQSGLAMGLQEDVMRKVFSDLLELGHLKPINSIRSHEPSNIHADAQLLGLSSAEIQSNRGKHRVLIYGAGRPAAILLSALESHDVPVGWIPASKERIRDEDLSGLGIEYISKRWDDLRVPIQNPHIAVCFDVTHDSEGIEAQFPNTIIFPVIVHQRRLAIGPLLGVKGGLCGSCLNQIRSTNDQDWSLGTAQLLHERRHPPVIAMRWANVLSWTLTNYLLELIDMKQSSALINHSLELQPPNPVWRLRSWEHYICTHRSTGEISPLGQE